MDENSKFCKECGAEISSGSQPAAQGPGPNEAQKSSPGVLGGMKRFTGKVAEKTVDVTGKAAKAAKPVAKRGWAATKGAAKKTGEATKKAGRKLQDKE
jgi:hypothetical protein